MSLQSWLKETKADVEDDENLRITGFKALESVPSSVQKHTDIGVGRNQVVVLQEGHALLWNIGRNLIGPPATSGPLPQLTSLAWIDLLSIWCAGGLDGGLRLLTSACANLGTFHFFSQPILSVASLPSTSRVIMGSVGTIWVVNLERDLIPATLVRSERLVFRYTVLKRVSLPQPVWIERLCVSLQQSSRHVVCFYGTSCTLVNLKDGQIEATATQCHPRPLTAACAMPSEGLLATGARDGSVALWSTLSLSKVHEFRNAHSRSVTGLEAAGHQLVVSCSLDGSLKLFDTDLGEILFRIDVGCAIFGVFMQRRVVFTVTKQGMSSWAVNHLTKLFCACRSPVWRLERITTRNHRVSRIIIAAEDSSVRVIDEEGCSLTTLFPLRTHEAIVDAATFLQEGIIAVLLSNAFICLVDAHHNPAKTLRTWTAFAPEQEPCWIAAIEQPSRRSHNAVLAVGLRSGCVTFVALDSGEILLRLQAHVVEMKCMSFCRASRMLATADSVGNVAVWDVGKLLNKSTASHFALEGPASLSVLFIRDFWLVLGTKSGCVSVAKVSGNERGEATPNHWHSQPVVWADADSERSLFVTGDGDGFVKVWRWENRLLNVSTVNLNQTVFTGCFLGHGNVLVAFGDHVHSISSDVFGVDIEERVSIRPSSDRPQTVAFSINQEDLGLDSMSSRCFVGDQRSDIQVGLSQQSRGDELSSLVALRRRLQEAKAESEQEMLRIAKEDEERSLNAQRKINSWRQPEMTAFQTAQAIRNVLEKRVTMQLHTDRLWRDVESLVKERALADSSGDWTTLLPSQSLPLDSDVDIHNAQSLFLDMITKMPVVPKTDSRPLLHSPKSPTSPDLPDAPPAVRAALKTVHRGRRASISIPQPPSAPPPQIAPRRVRKPTPGALRGSGSNPSLKRSSKQAKRLSVVTMQLGGDLDSGKYHPTITALVAAVKSDNASAIANGIRGVYANVAGILMDDDQADECVKLSVAALMQCITGVKMQLQVRVSAVRAILSLWGDQPWTLPDRDHNMHTVMKAITALDHHNNLPRQVAVARMRGAWLCSMVLRLFGFGISKVESWMRTRLRSLVLQKRALRSSASVIDDVLVDRQMELDETEQWLDDAGRGKPANYLARLKRALAEIDSVAQIEAVKAKV